MPLQILTLKLNGITAGDYLTWCRDPEPPALDFALRSISIDADPIGDTITAILDWNQPIPAATAAATAAGLPLSAGVQVNELDAQLSRSRSGEGGEALPGGVSPAAGVGCLAQVEGLGEVFTGGTRVSGGVCGQAEEVVDGPVRLRPTRRGDDAAREREKLLVDDRGAVGIA